MIAKLHCNIVLRISLSFVAFGMNGNECTPIASYNMIQYNSCIFNTRDNEDEYLNFQVVTQSST